MYILVDECCPKLFVHISEQAGHVAQRTIEVGQLGQSASDPAIFSLAKSFGAAVVTVNIGDYIRLAQLSPGHPGLMLLPSLPRARTCALFREMLPIAETLFASQTGMCVEADAEGAIRTFKLP